MFYVVLLLVAIVTWAAVRAVPASNALMRAGIGFVVVGALTTLFMWWMVVPELILAVGLVMLTVGWFRSHSMQSG